MAQGTFGGDCVEQHTVEIFDRGGRRRVGKLLDLSEVNWERARDNVSEASVRIEGNACDMQAEFIDTLRTHRHEMVIYRGKDRVWEGPLHRISSHPGYTELFARDVAEYLMHTPLSKDWSNAFPNITEVTTRLENIIEWELTHGRVQKVNGVNVNVAAWENLDPPINVLPYLDVHHWPNEARTSATTKAFEMTVGEHLASLARTSGIDFTVVGRSLHIWDVSRSLGRLRELTDADFLADVIVTEYGGDHTQAAYVIGQEGVYGSALNTEYLDYYGPWTRITTAYNEEGTEDPTAEELASQASRNISGRSPAPMEVRVPDNSSVVLSDTLHINQLVCGVQVPIRASLNARKLSQMQKIDHVTVNETSDGESVQLTLTPATREDSDEEE